MPPPGRMLFTPSSSFLMIVGQIAHHLGGAVEAHQHQPVLARTHHALDEPDRRLLLEAELLANAVARIDQHGQPQRQIGFGGELLDGLRLLVLDDVEIVFRQIGDETGLSCR